jgi:D-proline reductase (dithiol) PrdB
MEILENRAQWAEDFQAGWLAHYQEHNEFNWKLYKRPKNKSCPTGSGVDLSKSRLLFISTSGAYLPESQQPFDAAHPLGDYSIRRIPSSTLLDKVAYAHDHYDHAAVDEDPQVLMPLRYLEDLVQEGVIGEVSPSMVSFMGYHPDVTQVIDETIVEIVKVAKEEQVQAALLVPA